MLRDDRQTGLYHLIPRPSCLISVRRYFSIIKLIVVSVILSASCHCDKLLKKFNFRSCSRPFENGSTSNADKVQRQARNACPGCLHCQPRFSSGNLSRGPGTTGQMQNQFHSMVIVEILAEGLRRERTSHTFNNSIHHRGNPKRPPLYNI